MRTNQLTTTYTGTRQRKTNKSNVRKVRGGPDADIDAELALWGRAQFPLLGDLLELRSLATDVALTTAPTVFGFTGRVNSSHGVTWDLPDNEP